VSKRHIQHLPARRRGHPLGDHDSLP
jgi:hypothetical protein